MALPLYAADAAGHRTQPNQQVVLDRANFGLAYTRFFDRYDAGTWDVPEDGKRDWIKKFCGRAGNPTALAQAAKRLQNLVQALGGQTGVFKTQGNFVTGLGIDHPVENGLSFHPTLGVPYLGAAGVKGLLRAWVEVWMELPEGSDSASVIARWFGTASDKDGEGSAGNLIFFDAIAATPLTMAADVMTPHMGKWYEKGSEINAQAGANAPNSLANAAPADWHSPVPVPFLVVSDGEFQFGIAPRAVGDAAADAQARQDCATAWAQLQLALEWLGAGAKTAVGYGRMKSQEALLREQEQTRASDLAAAGIAQGEEEWPGLRLSWDKGKQALTVTSAAGKKITVRGDKANTLLQALDAEAVAKMKAKGKEIKANGRVRVNGNEFELLSLF